MPEMTFDVRWPDGERSRCYSPSLVIREHLRAGATYSVAEFRALATRALAIASERVERRYGHPCSHARARADAIRARCASFDDAARVVVERFDAPGDDARDVI